MQPYFFPYIGYWQLLKSVDRFVLLDDVNYSPGGWINRNRILINRQPAYFTIPLIGASQNRKICDIEITRETDWRAKLLKTLSVTFKNAPGFADTFEPIANIIAFESSNLADYLYNELASMAALLNIDTQIIRSARTYANAELKGEKRILDICAKNQTQIYVNLPGGRTLYDPAAFDSNGVALRFVNPRLIPYSQRANPDFVPQLSIIDLLMNVGLKQMQEHLSSYSLEV